MTQKHIHIGDWQIDRQNRIAKHPERGSFQLKGKSVQVLMVLVEANGAVVNKSDILKQVWPDIVVTENSLTQAISELRKVFGDSRNAPKYIQTFPNQGYCLCIPQGKENKEGKLAWLKHNYAYLSLALITIFILIFSWVYIDSPQKEVIISPDNKYTAIITKEATNYSLSIFVVDTSSSKDIFFHPTFL